MKQPYTKRTWAILRLVSLSFVVTATTTHANADTVTYNFSGAVTYYYGGGPWPSNLPPIGSPFSGTIAINDSVVGVPGIGNSVDFAGAIDYATLSVGGYFFSETGGEVISDGGGYLDFETSMGGNASSIASQFPGFYLAGIDLTNGEANAYGTSLANDLPGIVFPTTFGISYFIDPDSGGGFARGVGPITTLTSSPEPASLLLVLTSVLLGGLLERWRNGKGDSF
jgi:hypothetical protein